MSTHGNIIIKIDPKDIGKVIKFNAKKLPVRLERWDNEKARSKCKPITLERKYVGIYCHDCYFPQFRLHILREKFPNYNDILNLIAGGDCSYFTRESVLHYANRNGEQWEYIQPFQSDTIEPFANGDYIYIFENENWKCGKVNVNGNVEYVDLQT